MGIEPPMPIMATSVPHSVRSASCAVVSMAQSEGTRKAGPAPCSANDTEQSAGTRWRTKARNASRILAGSWSPTRRKEILADASAGITVLKPRPV